MRTPARAQGYTLIEFLVTLALLAIVAGLAFPPLQRTIYRTEVRSQIRKATSLNQVARMTAARRGFPVVVALLPASSEMVAFVDIHGAAAEDPPDGIFNPIDTLPVRSTDYELQRFTVAAGLTFREPGGATGAASVDGFGNPGALPAGVAIFDVNGSVRAAGAFRFADQRGNYFEVRVAPAATGKVQIRKWDSTAPVNWDGTHWYAEGEVERAWSWK
ncbi:MAG: prepilin-type N-terminal cleavage/methylation domain-containing protein [Thermoanaerobaculia bacterium]|nr:prepilin-type N-terminal cleavage/methylation domain-containing protein [Thermoanaerobaculia bacterium]